MSQFFLFRDTIPYQYILPYLEVNLIILMTPLKKFMDVETILIPRSSNHPFLSLRGGRKGRGWPIGKLFCATFGLT
jgi:hypothetical protein